jgi:hypothetical protein
MNESFNPAKKALNSVMKNNAVGRYLGLEKKQGAVLEIMKQQKIIGDPSKLANYKKKDFLKAINNSGIGFDAKKAFNVEYGERKSEISKTKTDIGVDSKKIYNEIMNKRKGDILSKERIILEDKKSNIQNFSTSNIGIRKASSLLAQSNKQAIEYDNHIEQQGDEETKNILRRIQS